MDITPGQPGEEITGAYYDGAGVWIVGLVGRVVVVDLASGKLDLHQNIAGVSSAVKAIYQVPGTVNIVIHQRGLQAILYDTAKRSVLGKFNSLVRTERTPIFMENSMIVYSSVQNYADVFNLTNTSIPAVRWDHRYTPGINYIHQVNNSNLLFVLSSEETTKFDLWETSTWKLVDSINLPGLSYKVSKIHWVPSPDGPKVIVNTNGALMVYLVKQGGKTELQLSKSEPAFDDIYFIQSQVHRYLQVKGDSVHLMISSSNSVLSSFNIEDLENPGIFSDGLRSNVYKVRNSKLRTYVNQKKIVLVNLSTKRLVRTITVVDEAIQSAYFSAEDDLWILGYNQAVYFFDLITNQLSKFDKGLLGRVREVYRVPGSQKVLIHQRNASFILYDLQTKEDTQFVGQVVPDREPLFSGEVMLVYATNSPTAEFFNLSNITAAPLVWRHGLTAGLNYVSRVGQSRFIIVRGIDNSYSLWDSYTLNRVSNITTFLTQPRLYTLPFANTIIFNVDSMTEVYNVDATTGVLSKPHFVDGLNFYDVYVQEGSEAHYLGALGFTALTSISYPSHSVLSHLPIFKIKNYYQIPYSDVVGYYYQHIDHLLIHEVRLTNGYHVANHLLDGVEGNVLSVAPLEGNASKLILRTNLFTYIYDKVNRQII